MGTEKPNNGYDPRVSALPLPEHNELGVPVSGDVGLFRAGDTAGSNLMHTSLPLNSFAWHDANASYPPCTQNGSESGFFTLADLMDIDSSQAMQTDFMRRNTPRNLNPTGISFPEQMARGVHQSTNNDYNTMTTHCFANNGTAARSFQNPQASRNIMRMRGNSAEGYQMNRPVGEGSITNINRPQTNRNFVAQGRPMWNHTLNGNRNSIQVNADKNAKIVNADQYGCVEKIDGSFLSLGLADDSDARPKPYSSSQGIPSNFEEAASPHLRTSHVGHATRSYSNLARNLGVSYSNSQNFSGSAHPIPSRSSGGLTSGYDVGAVHLTDTRLTSSPFHNLRTPQADMQQNIGSLNNRSSGYVTPFEWEEEFRNFDPYRGFPGDQAALSGAISSSSTASAISRQIIRPEFASGSRIGAWSTTGAASNQLQCMESANQLAVEMSANSPFLGVGGNSSWQGHPGQLFPVHDNIVPPAIDGNIFPSSIGLQTTSNSANLVMTGGVFPKRLGAQVLHGTSAQAAEVAPFHRGLGVLTGIPITTAPSELDQYPKSMAVQTSSSNICRPQPSGSVQYRRVLIRPPSSIGQPEALPAPYPTDFLAPSRTTGQPQSGVPDQYLRPMSNSGLPIPVTQVNELGQVCNALGPQSLKRASIQPHPAAPYMQRRKVTHQSLNCPSVQYQPQRAPAPFSMRAPAPFSVRAPTPTLAHIKWPGAEKPESSGEKCLLCKRDLTFSPEGPVEQPAILPAVAVLPCGHTFHDHCLEIITPEDQAKNPPCIPCAIGEN